MTSKRERHEAILRVVESEQVATQAQMLERLNDLGFRVTQPTLSRDCDELQLRKMRDAGGRLRYVAPETASDTDRLERLALLLSEFALSMVASGNLLVIRTPRGAAGPVACVIDRAPLPEVVATIAGEDTLLLVAREGLSGAAVRARFEGLIAEQAAAGEVVDLRAALADAHEVGHDADDLAALEGLRAYRSRRV